MSIYGFVIFPLTLFSFLYAIPTSISYRVTAMVIPIDSEILVQRQRCGRFILATNILDSLQFTADDALREYKAQQVTERGFRFLKDPSSACFVIVFPLPLRAECGF
ncbi:MAG: hypothetical protein ACK55Y_10760 [Pseudanabaena sp.]